VLFPVEVDLLTSLPELAALLPVEPDCLFVEVCPEVLACREPDVRVPEVVVSLLRDVPPD